MSINYAKKKCKARRDRSSDLNNTLNQLEKQLAIDPDQDILNEIERVKLIIEDLDSEVVDGIIGRATPRWSEKGKKK